MAVSVELGGCACWHSNAGMVDAVLRYLLHERRLSTRLIADLLAECASDSPPTYRSRGRLVFTAAYRQMSAAIVETFRSGLRGRVRAAVIVLGAACYLPSEVYVIRFPADCAADCAHSDDKHIRLASRALFTGGVGHSFKPLSKSQQSCFLLLSAKRNSNLEDIGFIEEPFKLESNARTKLQRIDIKHGCTYDPSPCLDCLNGADDYSWFLHSTTLKAFTE